MATTFADHTAPALELAVARADQQRMLLLADRDRIARDMHDHVIQRLFATGLTVQGTASGMTDERQRQRFEQVVSELDETIRQIRTSIFQLHGALAPTGSTVRARLLDICRRDDRIAALQTRCAFPGAKSTPSSRTAPLMILWPSSGNP
jgi:signal transduction histidine kinase